MFPELGVIVTAPFTGLRPLLNDTVGTETDSSQIKSNVIVFPALAKLGFPLSEEIETLVIDGSEVSFN